MKERLIFHIDVNSAFLSWEAVYRLKELNEKTDLRNIPSAIAGDKETRHGIILAKSTLAKECGVVTAQTIGDAIKKCPDIQLFPTRFEVYYRYSSDFFDVLNEYAPVVEKYSIDEAFCDMTGTMGMYGTPYKAALLIKDEIKNRLGFTVNVGISNNKILAKMASDFKKPDRIHTLFPDEIKEKMWSLPVSELFFVGKAATDKLMSMGITTIGELASIDIEILKFHFKKHGELMYAYANGVDDSEVETRRPDVKGYGNSITLPDDVSDIESAKSIILGLSEKVATRVRKDDAKVNVVAIQIVYSDFIKKRHQRTLNTPTNRTNGIFECACALFDNLWDGKPIRNIGISTSKVSDDMDVNQMTLFENDEEISHLSDLDKAVDKMREKYGNNIIKRGSLL